MHFSNIRLALFFAFLVPVSMWAQAPTAAFTSNKNTGCAPFPLVVVFQDQSTGNPTSWLWSFGDVNGSTSTLQNPTFIYSDPGCYNVSLTVTNANGSDVLVQNCFIEIFPQPQPGFVVDIVDGCAPLTVNITDTSVPNAPGISSWVYILSDGSNSNLQNPSFTFTLAPDTINIIFTVTNSNGCQSTFFSPAAIIVQEPPVLDFAVDVNSSCNPPLTVNFSNNSQANGAVNPVYTWTFPGGTTSGGSSTFTGQTPPPVTYVADGQYSVSLSVSSVNGCADTLVLDNLVGIGGVQADFSVDNTTICLGDTITFTNLSTGGVTSVGWNFGETPGLNSTANVVGHVYSAPGTYTVTLQANNPVCGDTLVRTAFIQVDPLPVAAFTPDRDLDCQPGNPFFFTNNSVGATARLWDFGDGTTSTQVSPNHTYTSFGNFTVCLTVTNAQGCSDVFCDTIRVAPPNVGFDATPREGCAPHVVDFVDQSTSPVDPIIGWQWNFGSPNAVPPTSNQSTETVTYPDSGTYSVTLIVVTQNGCTDTIRRNGFIRVGNPPLVDFTVNKDTVCINEDITFTSVNIHPDWEYYWDFQYQASGTFIQLDSMPTTIYPDTGLFDVALAIENNGCRDTLVRPQLVYVSPPRAQFQLSDTAICSLPATVAITDESVGPADTYEWLLNSVLISTQPTLPSVSITTPGIHTLTQIIENSLSGCRDTFIQVIRAGNPIASFTPSVTTGCRPLTVTFTNTSQNAVAYNWAFAFGTSTPGSGSGLATPTFTYPSTGTYTIRLIATDPFGCSDVLFVDSLITVIGPDAAFTSPDPSACPGESVSFSDASTAYQTTVVSWLWDFGDGTAPSTAQNPTHVYANAGSYTVNLTVTDNAGCTDTQVIPNFVNITFPIPSFTVDDDSSCAGNPLNFASTSVGAGLTYTWNFGDGGSGTTATPAHAYGAPGSYDVTLIATDINGCTDSITVPDFIFIEQFEANFGGDPRVGICPPLGTQFTDSTIGNVVGWRWDFGDGIGFSFLQNPGNVYVTPGSFDVTLIATHEDGCRDTLTKPDYVFVAGPNGIYDIQPDNVCLGDTITITTITAGAACAAFDFRDGIVVDTCNLTGGSDTLRIPHVYQNPGEYFPLIVLEDAQDCVFVLTGQDSTTVYQPPQAAISPVDTAGCSIFAVPFADATVLGDTTIASWAWDFGDGTTSILPAVLHEYSGDTTYDVTLVVVDANGCTDSAATTATVYEGVVPNFVADDTVGCAPFTVIFSDLSSNLPATGWNWDFGDGTTLSGVANPTHTYQNDGLYTVTLIVSDNLGCSDTLVRTDYIFLRRPEAILYADQTSGCNPVTITFFADSSVVYGSVVEHEWCITEVATGQTDCVTTDGGQTSLPYDFLVSGDYEVRVTITDSEGCSGTSEPLGLSITARVMPEPIEVRNVSVVDRRSARISWRPYPGSDFVEYAIHRIDGPAPGVVGTITDINITTFTETNPALDFEANSYCYKVLVRNTCDEYSLLDATAAHCTIDLETTPANDAIDLSWSAYVGYTVDQYEVYRSDSYTSTATILIGVVPGTTLTFTDRETFCRDSISYRVQAVGLGGFDQRSFSDIDANAPIHPQPRETSDIVSASVIDDSLVEVTWTAYNGYLPDRYYLEKSADGASWITVDTFPLGTQSYTDFDVSVDTRSYYYRIWALDQCGDRSAEGLYGKTILLNTRLDQTGKIPQLSWTAYEEWANGVLSYQIEVLNDQTGEFEPVDQIGGGVRQFADNLTRLDQATYCYRVRAIEVAGNGAEAFSNVACVTFGPGLFVPNAFTPNNDGDNDVFYIYAPNIAQAELSIYNRWGQLLYRSFDLQAGWDGSYKGRGVPEGVYVFTIEGVGVDGTPVSRSGTVTLFR
ncbi:MAG: hypothetical protein OHK0039_13970 [Bacteroidia bacterium]